jgi:hypothetical protein
MILAARVRTIAALMMVEQTDRTVPNGMLYEITAGN